MKKILMVSLASFSCLTLAFTGCARPKDAATKTLLGQTPPGPTGAAGAGAAGAADTATPSIEAAYKAYAGPEGLSQAEMKNLIRKFGNGEIDPLMVTYIFDDQTPASSKPQRLTLAELNARIPTLAWAPAGSPQAFAELDAKLAGNFPAASKTARDGVLELVQRYDEKWASGNLDQKLSQNELLVPGAILGIVMREDFSHGLPKRFGAPDQLSQLIDRKVNQQLFGRYTQNTYLALPSDDLKLEWAQLLLRKQLLERQLKETKGAITETDRAAFLARWGIQEASSDADKWSKLARLYDQKVFFMGDGDGKLNTAEAFNFLTDVTYARAVMAAFDGNFNVVGAAKHPEQAKALGALYPRVGSQLMVDEAGKVRETFWSSLDEGASQLPSVAVTLATARVCDAIFTGYDANHDNLLQRAEADAATAAVGLKNTGTMLDMMYMGSNELSASEFFPKLQGLLASAG